jgi:phage repressor protein C with HTH and peptisase S24 domain
MVSNNYKQEMAARLRDALKASPLSKKAIERSMGVSYTSVQNWFKHGTIDDKHLRELCDLLKTDYVWIVAGETPTGVREHTSEYLTERDTLIAVYDVELSAGNGMEAPEYIETKKKLPFDSQWLQKHDLKPHNLMVLYVAGDSMLPTMEDGDSVLIDKSRTKIIDRKIYGIVLGGECEIKRLSQKFDGSIEVISDNPMHTTETIPPSELEHLHIIGQAVYRSGML